MQYRQKSSVEEVLIQRSQSDLVHKQTNWNQLTSCTRLRHSLLLSYLTVCDINKDSQNEAGD